MAKFKLSITTFDLVGGIHNYGSVYKNGVKVYECEHPDPGSQPVWWTPDDGVWTTIKFGSYLDVVKAAKKWFLTAIQVSPGDKLVVWTGYFSKEELKQIREGL